MCNLYRRDRIIRAYTEIASAKPVPRKPPRRPADDKKDGKKEEKE
jgi:hypothetical protein